MKGDGYAMNPFIPYKERSIEIGQLVALHWNSHKNVYSIVRMKSKKTIGEVVGYCKQATLSNAYTKIELSKQKTVKETSVKDRHAYIVGHLENFEKETLSHNMYYNPHVVNDFVDAASYFNDKQIVHIENAKRVNLDHDGIRPVVTYEK